LLDLLITRENATLVSGIYLHPGLSDHFAVMSQLSLQKPHPPKVIITTRNIKSIDVDVFRNDLVVLLSDFDMTSTDLDSCVQNYEVILSSLLNKHAPARTRSVRLRPHSPWFNDAIQTARKLRRVHERKWRHSRLEIDRQLYCNQRQRVNELINVAKIEYYSSPITDCSGDQKKLFKVVDGLLNQTKEKPVLPSSVSDAVLADSFSNYFSNKIVNIRSIFPVATSSTISQTNHLPVCAHVTKISQFESATVSEIIKLISSSPSKSCELDPIPTHLLKRCINVLAPLITTIVNKSFEQGNFPDSLKTAYIRPLIKKPGLDIETFSNYRPGLI
jgi:hypothetical protein